MAVNLIGEYLRARREQVRPVDVGITTTSHRRVPDLRRDELAMPAGSAPSATRGSNKAEK